MIFNEEPIRFSEYISIKKTKSKHNDILDDLKECIKHTHQQLKGAMVMCDQNEITMPSLHERSVTEIEKLRREIASMKND